MQPKHQSLSAILRILLLILCHLANICFIHAFMPFPPESRFLKPLKRIRMQPFFACLTRV